METAPLTVNDIHTYAQPEETVIKHLDWAAEVDFENKKIRAIASLTIEKAEKCPLFNPGYQGIKHRKSYPGRSSRTSYFYPGRQRPMDGVPLMINIESNTSVVHVHYATGEGAEALQWLVPQQTSGGKHPFLSPSRRPYLPGVGFLFRTLRAFVLPIPQRVKVPSGLMALMSAENPVEKSADGLYTFTMNQPIPAYLLALAVGDLTFQAVSNRTGVYAEPAIIDKAVYEFGEWRRWCRSQSLCMGLINGIAMTCWFCRPASLWWDGKSAVNFATPTILAGDRSLTSLVAHELAHSWSGNLVTNGTWNDFWINEGFTVYFEHRIMEKIIWQGLFGDVGVTGYAGFGK